MSIHDNDFLKGKIEELTEMQDNISKEKLKAKLQLSMQKTVSNLTEFQNSVITTSNSLSLSELLQLYIQLEKILEDVHAIRRKYNL